MSRDWVKDIHEMHTKFGVRDWVDNQIGLGRYDKLEKFLEFRLKFLNEELTEAMDGLTEKNSEDIVDAMIDLCVVAIGTLDALGVNAYRAWDSVHHANMTKKPGVKPNRPNPLGLPDLMKPDGWVGPDHTGNHGIIDAIFYDDVATTFTTSEDIAKLWSSQGH